MEYLNKQNLISVLEKLPEHVNLTKNSKLVSIEILYSAAASFDSVDPDESLESWKPLEDIPELTEGLSLFKLIKFNYIDDTYSLLVIPSASSEFASTEDFESYLGI